jgi:hypothetical protein
MLPWAEASRGPGDERSVQEIAAAMAAARRKELEAGASPRRDLKAWHGRTSMRVITPGSRPVSRSTSCRRSSAARRAGIRTIESARATLSAAISLVLRLIGRDPDPAKSREHVLLERARRARLCARVRAQSSARSCKR